MSTSTIHGLAYLATEKQAGRIQVLKNRDWVKRDFGPSYPL
jgi:hypothetical protein